MSEDILYREYRQEDFNKVVNIIIKVWQYDEMLKPKKALAMARLDLAKTLRKATFSQVAIKDNEVIGFIFGSDLTKEPNTEYDKEIALLKKFITKDLAGKFVGKFIKKLDKINDGLMAENGKKYDAELAFFALEDKCRGLGIGKKLYNDFNHYLEENNLKNFYLFTDSTCNYGFYDHLGMKRCGEKEVKIPFVKKGKFQFYLYELEK